ncbi:hypothetical protein BGZ65_012262, partial [Modicella reniformis]
MSTQTTTAQEGSIPRFESTLVIAFPDVLGAGPKILLSAANAGTSGSSIPAWSHYFKKLSTTRKSKTSTKTTDNDTKLGYSTTTLADQQKVSLLTIAAAPPTTEQASYLCEAIVSQARDSGTSRIVLVASSNFPTKDLRTHVLKLHHDSGPGFPEAPKNVSLGDHILNTFLTLLTFVNIPTTVLVHPAQKGVSLRELQAVIVNLTAGLTSVLGDSSLKEFSSERAFNHVFRMEDEESFGSLMYL